MTLDEMLRTHPLNVFDIPQFAAIAEKFVAGTRFDGKFLVNTSVMPGMLGIFFCRFDRDQRGPQDELRNNCAYVRGDDDRHYIICDIDFLADWRNSLADPNDPMGIGTASWPSEGISGTSIPADYEEMFRVFFRGNLEHFFPNWVIGHEMGHAALGHCGALLGERELKEREVAADLFVIERMVWNEDSRINFFSAITHLLNDWIRKETGENSVRLGARDYGGPSVKIRDTSVTHSPMIVRLLDLIDAFLGRFPMDTTGYFSRLRAQIQMVR